MLKLNFENLKNLNVLKNIDVELEIGRIYYLLGPNGSGKSSLAKVIVGFPNYEIADGKIVFNKEVISELDMTERARLGIFLAFQNPVEIPGVSFRNFLRIAYNNTKEKDSQLSVFKFKELVLEKAKIFDINPEILDKNLNENLSGGEKKKMEILQMAILEPELAILDEIDSGLDIDSVKSVYKGIAKLKQTLPNMTLLIISHSLSPFEFLKPDKVMIMKKGSIVIEGNNELIEEIKKNGYKNI